MSRFDFISGDNFRDSLNSDYLELTSCLEHQAWKAVHVLSGSIVEAILIDYLVSSNYQNRTSTDLLKLDLGNAITICREEGILSPRAAELSSVVRSYRNLIHPGRIIRTGEQVDENGAKIAAVLVEIIANEVSVKKRENYGYTAEQIVNKLEIDPSSVAILEHLLSTTNTFEVERILTSIIPKRHWQLDEETEKEAMDALEKGFRITFDISSQEIKTKTTKSFVKLLKNGSAREISWHELNFFRASDLQFLNPEEISLVKQHLFSVTERGISEDILIMLQGIGKYIQSNEIEKFIDPIIRILVTAQRKGFHENIRDFLIAEQDNMDFKIQDGIVSRVRAWSGNFHQQGRSSYAQIANDLADTIDIMPF